MEKLNINDSTDFYDNARSSRNEKAQRRVNGQKGDIDASGWKEPTMETERKTGGQPAPRAYKRGGKVEGEESKKHAGRKPRASGGKLGDYLSKATRSLRNSSKAETGHKYSAAEYESIRDREPWQVDAAKTHRDFAKNQGEKADKRMSGIDMALDKLSGKAKVSATRASGGKVHAKGCTCKMCSGGEAKVSRETRATGGSANYTGSTRPTGDRIAKASGGKLMEYTRAALKDRFKNDFESAKQKDRGNSAEASRAEKTVARRSRGIPMALDKLENKAKVNASYAKGGKVKGKTDIHININSAPKPPMPLPVPIPPAGAMPPPMPAGGPPMGGGPLPPGLGVPPPAMGAGPMPRASGGRVKLEAGAGSGLGRLEKIEIQKRH